MTMVSEFGFEQAVGLVRAPQAADSKYTRGVVGLLTGSEQYPGAAVLGVEGAARAGAGYVRYVGPRRCQDAILARRPETVFAVGATDSWVIGSGMAGLSEDDPRHETIMQFLDPAAPQASADHPAPFVVADAGALRAFTRCEHPTGDAVHERYIVTPHSGELARILELGGYAVTRSDIDASDSSRLTWASRARDLLGATVVLKGATTLVVPVDRGGFSVTSPTTWLATAGTGDVLAGMMGTLVAQNAAGIRSSDVSLGQIAALAVYVHGLAAGLASRTIDGVPRDQVARPGQPLVAMDVADRVPQALGLLLARTA